MVSNLGAFLRNRQNFIALFSLVPIGLWVYSRVWMVNPAILGDEYLYSINARKVSPWDPSPAGDFSNYLFNFVYQSTNLCGSSFYSCGKILNLFFFLAFVFSLYIVAIRFLPFWASLSFMVAAGLSPLSVYTSMFLPESMYLFFMGLLFISVLRAINVNTYKSWAVVGLIIGLASLVKPHAWLSAIAVAITLTIVCLGSNNQKFRLLSMNLLSLIVSAVLARGIVGLLVAGPKALGFFGQYLGQSTLEQVVRGPVGSSDTGIVGSSPMAGVFGLFSVQLNIHLLVMSALMAISVIAITVGVLKIFKSKSLSGPAGLALFSFIWFFSLLIEIVIFTGWVTGGGDDHSTRVLLRYYEFLYLIIPLAGLINLNQQRSEKTNVLVRWGLVVIFSALLTQAFSGFFGMLTIQIADAPTLAGLVVNPDLFNLIAILSLVSILIYATFPRFAVLAAASLLPFTLVGLGWEIQGQYQGFRATDNPADLAGKYLATNFEEGIRDRSIIISTSRFDATLAALWADSVGISYELYVPGTQLNGEAYLSKFENVVVVGDISLVNALPKTDQDGFRIYSSR